MLLLTAAVVPLARAARACGALTPVAAEEAELRLCGRLARGSRAARTGRRAPQSDSALRCMPSFHILLLQDCMARPSDRRGRREGHILGLMAVA